MQSLAICTQVLLRALISQIQLVSLLLSYHFLSLAPPTLKILKLGLAYKLTAMCALFLSADTGAGLIKTATIHR